MLHVRQADFLDHCAELFQLLDAGLDPFGDARVEAGAEVLLRQADAQALQRGVEVGAVVRHRFVDAGGVLGVEAGHALQQQGAVFGGAGQRAALVEARRVGDHAPARNTAVGRLEAGEVGQRRRLADRATGVGAGAGRQQARGHGRGGTAGRTARHVFEVPRVLHRAVVAGLVGRAHGEFVHVGLAQGDHAGGGQLGDHGRVIRRLEVVEHLRAAAGAHAVGAEQVLVGDRRAQQGTVLAGSATGVGGTGLAQGQLVGDADEAVELRVELLDARQQGAGQLFGGKRLVGESAGDLGQGQLMHGRLYSLTR
ncbi:hypothetical protein D3C81_1375290 [compost metagenome]